MSAPASFSLATHAPWSSQWNSGSHAHAVSAPLQPGSGAPRNGARRIARNAQEVVLIAAVYRESGRSSQPERKSSPRVGTGPNRAPRGRRPLTAGSPGDVGRKRRCSTARPAGAPFGRRLRPRREHVRLRVPRTRRRPLDAPRQVPAFTDQRRGLHGSTAEFCQSMARPSQKCGRISSTCGARGVDRSANPPGRSGP